MSVSVAASPRNQVLMVTSVKEPAVTRAFSCLTGGVRDAIELARHNQRSQQCPILGTLVAPSEQGVLGIEPYRPHRTRDRVDVHAPIVKIERQAAPTTQRIAQSLRCLTLLHELDHLRHQNIEYVAAPRCVTWG